MSEFSEMRKLGSSQYKRKRYMGMGVVLLLANDLQKYLPLLRHGEFHDVTLVVEGKEFRSHRAYLSAFSNVFEVMFTNDMKESGQDRIVLNGFSSVCLRRLCAYCTWVDLLQRTLLKSTIRTCAPIFINWIV